MQRLEAAYLDLLGTARAQNTQLFIPKDLALHESMRQIAANEYLQIALRRIVHPIFAFAAIRTLSSDPFDLLEDAHSHLPILEATKAKNPVAGREAFINAVDNWFFKTRALYPDKGKTSR